MYESERLMPYYRIVKKLTGIEIELKWKAFHDQPSVSLTTENF
jgi:hypothetical protein